MEYKKKLYRQDVILSPLRILRQQTKQIIATYLDSRKILLTETKLHRYVLFKNLYFFYTFNTFNFLFYF